MGNETNKVICSMVGVSKYYDKKPVLIKHLAPTFG